MNSTPTPVTPNTSEEALIERRVTFRNSTFGGLKTFIREHRKRTGQELTNSAAVDILVRKALAYEVSPYSYQHLMSQTKPGSAQQLRAVPDGEPKEAPEQSPETPSAILATRPRIRLAPSFINVEPNRPRPWLQLKLGEGE